MSEQNHQPPPGDLFDRAAAAVRGQATPEPPADLAAAIQAAVTNRLQLAEARAWRRRWIVRGMSIGGLAACLAVAVSWGNPAYALDPVIQKMKAAESARFTLAQITGDQPPTTAKVWVRGHLSRIEIGDKATVLVADHNRRRGLLTVPAFNRFERLPRPGMELEASGEKTPLDKFLAVRDAKAERLGKELVGGVNADKLKATQPAVGGAPAWEWTLWLDPATALPVKMVGTSTTAAGDKEVAVESVFTDFAWNEKFPDTLFSLDPPDGYTEGSPGRRASPKEKTYPVSLRVALENEQKASSFRAVTRTVRADAKPGDQPAEHRVYSAGDKLRMEMGEVTSVTDGKRLVLLNAATKVAQVADLPAEPGELAKGVMTGVRTLLDAQDGKGDVTPVPAVEVGGKKRPGFQVGGVEFLPGQPVGVTYYLDEERKLPARYVITLSAPVRMTMTTDYLGWDEGLDPKLFDLTVPDGYKTEELKLPPAPTKK